MTYNFVEKLRNREFSLREDYRHTLEDLESLFNKTPFGWTTNKLEILLGHLEARDKVLINCAYAFSAYIAGLAMYNYSLRDTPPQNALEAAACVVGVGLLHHIAMGERRHLNKAADNGLPQ